MMKMLIALDEPRIKYCSNEYTLSEIWKMIDQSFTKACSKKVLADGSVLYSGKEKKDYYSCMMGAYIHLKGCPWFGKYCIKWILFDNQDNPDLPFQDIDLLARQIGCNPLFAEAQPVQYDLRKTVRVELDERRMMAHAVYPEGNKTLEEVFKELGFSYVKDNGYVSDDRLDSIALTDLIGQFIARLPWFPACVAKLTVSNYYPKLDLTDHIKAYVAEMRNRNGDSGDKE